MSDINRLAATCEFCEKQYGLTLTACSGGAVGDVYLCRQCFNRHIAEFGEGDPCAECLAMDRENQDLYQFQL